MKTVEEVSNIINVPEHTVRRWLTNGTLEGIKFGRQWRISQETLDLLLEEGINVN